MYQTLADLFANVYRLRIALAEARESSRTASAAAEYERQLHEAQAQLDSVIAEAEGNY